MRTHLTSLPLLAKTAIALALIVVVPQVASRLRVPAVVALVLSGILIGPHGVEIFGTDRPIVNFFAELDKILLMFMAGLEIDLVLFRRVRLRSIQFGVITSVFPLALGTLVGLAFHYSLLGSLVIGSLLASHTLLGASIVRRLGETQRESITVTYGATMFSDTFSLIVFAICLSTFQRGFAIGSTGLLLLEIAVYVPLILVGLSRAGAYVLRKLENDENAYLAVMLLIVAIASVLAEAIQLPDIVGAFLSGLAVNAAVKQRKEKTALEFMANSFFVPIFFVTTGFLIDPRALVGTLSNDLPLVLAIIAALLVGKYAAAQIAGQRFGYTRDERLTVWSLTLPQVAATLAATLVAYRTFDAAHQRLLDDRLLNVVLVLMLVTAIVGPVLTQRFAPRLVASASAQSPIAVTPHPAPP